MTTDALIGKPLPHVALQDSSGGVTHVPQDWKGRWTLLYFYPKDDTPGCTVENQDFSALAGDFAAAGAALLGISKDAPARHQKFIAKYDLKAPLASDAAEGGLSDALGVWAEKVNYGRTYMGMVRSTYLVDSEGRILRIWDKVKVKGHAAEVLEAVRAA